MKLFVSGIFLCALSITILLFLFNEIRKGRELRGAAIIGYFSISVTAVGIIFCLVSLIFGI